MAPCDVSFCYCFLLSLSPLLLLLLWSKRRRRMTSFFACCREKISHSEKPASITIGNISLASQGRKEGHLSAPSLSVSDLWRRETMWHMHRASYISHYPSHSLMVKVHLRILLSSSVPCPPMCTSFLAFVETTNHLLSPSPHQLQKQHRVRGTSFSTSSRQQQQKNWLLVQLDPELVRTQIL